MENTKLQTNEDLGMSEMEQTEYLDQPIPVKRTAVGRPAGAIVDASKVGQWQETQSLIAELSASLGMPLISLYIAENSRLTYQEPGELYWHLSKLGKQPKLIDFFFFSSFPAL